MKNIEFFNFISDVYNPKRKHCLEILSNSHYIVVFQQTDRDVACLIFDQNGTKIKPIKIIDQSCSNFLSKLIVKVFSTQIICLYCYKYSPSIWTIAILDVKTLEVIRKKKLKDINENEKFNTLCASEESIDLFTFDNKILKYSWCLNKINHEQSLEYIFQQNTQRILQAETKHDKYFILCKEKLNLLNPNKNLKTNLVIMTKKTLLIEKSVEVESDQFLFDSNENLIFVSMDKIFTFNIKGDLENETNLISNITYCKKILFISDSKDKIKAYDEDKLSIKIFNK